MSTPAAAAKSPRKKATKPPSRPASKLTEPSRATARSTSTAKKGDAQRAIVLTIPLERAASAAEKIVTMPFKTAQRVLPAKGGLPLYLGVGALGIVGILEWPVAAGIGIGYAVLRHGGLLDPAPGSRAKSSDRLGK